VPSPAAGSWLGPAPAAGCAAHWAAASVAWTGCFQRAAQSAASACRGPERTPPSAGHCGRARGAGSPLRVRECQRLSWSTRCSPASSARAWRPRAERALTPAGARGRRRARRADRAPGPGALAQPARGRAAAGRRPGRHQPGGALARGGRGCARRGCAPRAHARAARRLARDAGAGCRGARACRARRCAGFPQALHAREDALANMHCRMR